MSKYIPCQRQFSRIFGWADQRRMEDIQQPSRTRVHQVPTSLRPCCIPTNKKDKGIRNNQTRYHPVIGSAVKHGGQKRTGIITRLQLFTEWVANLFHRQPSGNFARASYFWQSKIKIGMLRNNLEDMKERLLVMYNLEVTKRYLLPSQLMSGHLAT